MDTRVSWQRRLYSALCHFRGTRRNPVDVDYVKRIYRIISRISIYISAPRVASRGGRALCILLNSPAASLPTAGPLTCRLPTGDVVPRPRRAARRAHLQFMRTFHSTLYIAAALLHAVATSRRPVDAKRRRREYTSSPPLSPRRFLFCSPFPFFFPLFSTSFSPHGACHGGSNAALFRIMLSRIIAECSLSFIEPSSFGGELRFFATSNTEDSRWWIRNWARFTRSIYIWFSMRGARCFSDEFLENFV